jgi:hypothetical protein
MSTSNEQIADLDPRSAALAAAVLEVARFLGEDPQDHVRWFALLGSAELLAQQPSLAALLGPEAAARTRLNSLILSTRSRSSPGRRTLRDSPPRSCFLRVRGHPRPGGPMVPQGPTVITPRTRTFAPWSR